VRALRECGNEPAGSMKVGHSSSSATISFSIASYG
jgi:hypothetical protein